jgi:hypothetical protein
MNRHFFSLSLTTAGIVVWLVLASASTTGALAQARPTVQPLPITPTATAAAAVATPDTGAHIVFDTPPGADGLHAIVQWQGDDGRWYPVEGWQSHTVRAGQRIVWWVAPQNFGTGPFRWALFASPRAMLEHDARPVMHSADFGLPRYAGEHVVVGMK